MIKNLNKLFLSITIFSLIFGSQFNVSKAAATTLGLSASKTSVNVGSTFTVSVVVNPHTDNVVTVKASISFPADLVSVKSWSFGSGWTPLNQPGYDLQDNSSGSLIKTAGFAVGFNSPKTLGTITFSAKNNGVANIKVTSDSQVLDTDTQDAFAGGGSVQVTIGKPTTEAAPTTTTSNKTTAVKPTPTGKATTKITQDQKPTATPVVESNMPIIYSASLINDQIYTGQSLGVLVKLQNLKLTDKEKDILVTNTIYNVDKKAIKTQTRTGLLQRQNTFADVIDVSKLPAGNYTLINQTQVAMQTSSYQTELNFTISDSPEGQSSQKHLLDILPILAINIVLVVLGIFIGKLLASRVKRRIR